MILFEIKILALNIFGIKEGKSDISLTIIKSVTNLLPTKFTILKSLHKITQANVSNSKYKRYGLCFIKCTKLAKVTHLDI